MGMAHSLSRSSPVFARLLILTAVFWAGVQFLPFSGPRNLSQTMIRASQIMARAANVLQEARADLGIKIDEKNDPNRTGLIGVESSPITTSVGQLEAKRTTTNPNFAGLAVLLLHRAGVRSRDTIAIGASGSFPALIVAVLSAATAMEVNALLIPSLGASQWGANRADFHWGIMQQILQSHNLLNFETVAISMGGDQDMGKRLPPEGRRLLQDALNSSPWAIIQETVLASNVLTRMQLFRSAAGDSPIQAYVNIGGSWSNLGTDSLVLNVKPGLAHIRRFPRLEKQGMVFAMAGSGVPVLHLLYIRGLTLEFALPWDPVPLPEPGRGRMYQQTRLQSGAFVLLALSYMAAAGGMILIDLRKKTPGSGR
jgi:poly-gamma-glutamate system protein